MFASQPIAVANSAHNDARSSLPAGSPMSLTTGSFQHRFYPGGSPGQSLGPIAMPDANSWPRPTPSSFPDHDLCRNYTCCGVALPDLHALVDHFESCHVEVFPPDPVSQFDAPDAPDVHPVDAPAFDADDMDISEPSPSPPATPSPVLHHPSAFEPIRVMALSASQSPASARLFRPAQYSSYSSLAGANGAPTHARSSAGGPAPSAFNRYAGYSDYSSDLPGTDPSPTYTYTEADAEALALATCVNPFRDAYHFGSFADSDGFAYPDKSSAAYAYDSSAGMGAGGAGGTSGDMGAMRCVPPALLCSQSAAPSPLNTPGSSRAPSPALGGPVYTPPSQGVQANGSTLSLNPKSSSNGVSSVSRSSATSQGLFSRLAKSTPSSSSSSPRGANGHAPKPFHCPKPGCNKAYKQQNGLKYHLAHGACNYAPRDPEVERLSEGERERRERPWVCAVGSVGLEGGEGGQALVCGRRYKNMNGLRYHYTHTGAHGAVGLELLTQGRHPLPESPNANRAGKTTSTGVVAGTAANGAAPARSQGQASPTPSQAGSSVGQASRVPSPQQTQSQSPAPLQGHVQTGSGQRTTGTTTGTVGATVGAALGSGAGYFPAGQPPRAAPLPPVVSMPAQTMAPSITSSLMCAMGTSSMTPSMMTVPVPRPVAAPVRLRSGGKDARTVVEGEVDVVDVEMEMEVQGRGRAVRGEGKKEQKSPAPSPMSPFLGVPWGE